jgi:hypothetical protein
MANTQAMATSFKGELLNAYHNFSATNPARTINTADSFKAALYLASATVNATTTAYTTTGEVTGTNYTAGGVAITSWNAPSTSGTTGFTTPTASFTYTNVTLSTAFDCVLVYNNSQTNRAVSAHTFGSQTVTAGTFTLTMPTNDATNALIRIA